jgi:hypothetical protein
LLADIIIDDDQVRLKAVRQLENSLDISPGLYRIFTGKRQPDDRRDIRIVVND